MANSNFWRDWERRQKKDLGIRDVLRQTYVDVAEYFPTVTVFTIPGHLLNDTPSPAPTATIARWLDELPHEVAEVIMLHIPIIDRVYLAQVDKCFAKLLSCRGWLRLHAYNDAANIMLGEQTLSSAIFGNHRTWCSHGTESPFSYDFYCDTCNLSCYCGSSRWFSHLSTELQRLELPTYEGLLQAISYEHLKGVLEIKLIRRGEEALLSGGERWMKMTLWRIEHMWKPYIEKDSGQGMLALLTAFIEISTQ
jgi:hypothetical protein